MQLLRGGGSRGMGGCLSTPRGYVSLNSRSLRRRGIKKNRTLGYDRFSKDFVVEEDSGKLDTTAFAGSVNVVWFEPNTLYESASDSEDEYHSVKDMLDDSEDVFSSTFLLEKDVTEEEKNPSFNPFISSNLIAVPKELQSKNLTQSSADVFSEKVAHKFETSGEAKNKVFVDDKRLQRVNTSFSLDKRRSDTSSPMSAKKKVVPEHTLMSYEGRNKSVIPSSTMLRKRPVAGSQFPICPRGKEMFDSWSPIEPSTFRVRGMNYQRDKKKEYASSKAAYIPFGVDVYLSHRKINHIARLVELPVISPSSTLPAILVVNVQIPLYAPSIFQNENDGEGMNVVMYFKLLEEFEKELPSHFQESIKKLIDDEVENVKAFPTPFRERLKILGRVANVDDLQLNAPQRKLMHAYNEKPILSRPQHEFYSGENYFEIDLDMHRFNYISRKGFDAFQDKLKMCILDIGLTIQGNKVEELPEQILCCIRINGIDHTKYSSLEPSEERL